MLCGLFHIEQDPDERLFDILVHGFHRRHVAELLPQSLVELQRDVGIFGRVGRCCFEVYLVECQLLGTFARNVFEVDGFLAEVLACHGVHVMSCCYAVEHVGLEH